MGGCLEEIVPAKPVHGSEQFRGHREGPPLPVIDYWKWSASNLLDNTSRGIVAEFLVAAALGLTHKPRIEWGSHDLELRPGVTIEVKSWAFYQSWRQKQRSAIKFSIARRKRWCPEAQRWSDKAARWAKLYVFCVLEGCDPLDTSTWEFLVLRTTVLDDKRPLAEKIRLEALRGLEPWRCGYTALKGIIERAVNGIRD